jgi:hypothetical protein
VLIPSSSASLPSFIHNDKTMCKLFGELMLPPHKGMVPSTCRPQVKTALEKILLCYKGVATEEERLLIDDASRDKKGDRETLLVTLDQRVASHFKGLYETYNKEKDLPTSIKQWIKMKVSLSS